MFIIFSILGGKVLNINSKLIGKKSDLHMSGTVLLVDDHQNIADSAARFLQSRGYKTLVAYNAEDALQYVGEADILVTDVRMPGKDGYWLMQQAHARHPSLKVILATTDIDPHSALGAVDEVRKPYSPIELVNAIARHMPANVRRTESGVYRLDDLI